MRRTDIAAIKRSHDRILAKQGATTRTNKGARTMPTTTTKQPPSTPADDLLTDDDRGLIQRYGLDEAAFIETRRRERAEREAARAERERSQTTVETIEIPPVVLTADDERAIERMELAGVTDARAKFLATREQELLDREAVKR